MTPAHPDNEPGPGDRSSDPNERAEQVSPADLPDDDAESLGDFA